VVSRLRPQMSAPESVPAIRSLVQHRNLLRHNEPTLKYFWTVSALILVQIGNGCFTAHYGVEGEDSMVCR